MAGAREGGAVKSLVGGSPFMRRVLAALAVGSLVLAGCGGGSRADEKAEGDDAVQSADDAASKGAESGAEGGGEATSTTTKPAAGGASNATTTTTAKAGSSGGSGSSKSSGDKGSTPTTRDPASRTMPMTLDLQEPCVRPGGSQVVVVQALPNAGIAFDTEYSDGKTGMMEGHYGGNNAGYADDEGRFASTFAVAPNAPAGNATVLVLGSHQDGGFGEAKATFQVADALGKCS